MLILLTPRCTRQAATTLSFLEHGRRSKKATRAARDGDGGDDAMEEAKKSKEKAAAAAAAEAATTAAAAEAAAAPPEAPHPLLDSLPRDALLAAKMAGLERRAGAGDPAARQQLDDLRRGVAASAQQHWGEREGLRQQRLEDEQQEEEEEKGKKGGKGGEAG